MPGKIGGWLLFAEIAVSVISLIFRVITHAQPPTCISRSRTPPWVGGGGGGGGGGGVALPYTRQAVWAARGGKTKTARDRKR